MAAPLLTPDKIEAMLSLTKAAGDAIMRVYQSESDIAFTVKSDDSPVTVADAVAHEILVPGLQQLFPAIPVVSEEGDEEQNRRLVTSGTYIAVDPLDGTREFINRTDDFAVCLAIIIDNIPVFGIVSAPAKGEVFYGGQQTGSFKQINGQAQQAIAVSTGKQGIVLGSRAAVNEATQRYIKMHFHGCQVVPVGSQLKLPYIADGRADAYPRLESPLHHWDVAPGHAILVGAGGSVERPDGSPVDYRDPGLIAGDFIARSSRSHTS